MPTNDDSTRPPNEPMSREHIGELVAQGVQMVDALRQFVDELGDREVTGAVWDAQRALRSAHANLAGDTLPAGRPVYVVDGHDLQFQSGASQVRTGWIEVVVEDNAVDFALVATPATMTAIGLTLAAMTASHVASEAGQ